MTHEEFVKLASEAGRNAQGLRPLAAHVRQLYEHIRTLQIEDNSFYYIAEVIQQARQDSTDAMGFMNRVKSYYHRDREAAGDPLVIRGRGRLAQEQGTTQTTNSMRAATPTLNRPAVALEEAMVPKPMATENPDREQTVGVDGNETPAPLAQRVEQTVVRRDLGALTSALHNRPGRRRVVSGG